MVRSRRAGSCAARLADREGLKVSPPTGETSMIARVEVSRRRLLAAMGMGLVCVASKDAKAQAVAWPSFGPDQPLLRLNGLTDALPDFVGPIDGSAELTIFTEGNHYPVLLPLVFDAFPKWCGAVGSCHVDSREILVVTLPQAMIVEMLTKGGVRAGNAVIPVGRAQGIFPNLIMAGVEPLRQLAADGIAESRATTFARHRGLGLLIRKDLADVSDIDSFNIRVKRLVIASESEPAARAQYRTTLTALAGNTTTEALFAHEVRDFPGRLGIQHRDVPYAILNNLADGGIIFSHLASFYARTFPDRLSFVGVPAAETFGQPIAMARAADEHGTLTAAFERFFLEAARTAYPEGGFAAAESFAFGTAVDLATPSLPDHKQR